MPNHITNRLEIRGTTEEVKAVRDFLKPKKDSDIDQEHRKCYIDFNSIVKKPKIIQEVGGICCGTEDAVKRVFGKQTYFHSENRVKDMFKRWTAKEKKQFLKACEAYAKTGYIYWYDWCLDNWGTKWNAYGQKIIRDNLIEFETAWSNVIDLMKMVSAKFPKVSFYYEWADEDTGANCGWYTLHEGDVIDEYLPKNGTKEAYDMSFKIHPDDKRHYKLIDGNYEYDEDAE